MTDTNVLNRHKQPTSSDSQDNEWEVGGTMTVVSGGTMTVESGGAIAIESGGSQTIESGGVVTVKSGGDVAIESGGVLTVESGGSIVLDAGATQVRAGVQLLTPICGNAKVGATSGWIITAADDISQATLPAAETSSTLVIPITGINIGDTLTGISVSGQVESAGADVTLVMSVRKTVAVAAGNTDAELGTDNVGTLTADTLISSATLAVTGLTEVLAEGEAVYVLLTGTTAAVTDIALNSIIATVTRA